jgi:hypothetical protein
VDFLPRGPKSSFQSLRQTQDSSVVPLRDALGAAGAHYDPSTPVVFAASG